MNDIAFRRSRSQAEPLASVAELGRILHAAQERRLQDKSSADREEFLANLNEAISRLHAFAGRTPGELIAWMRSSLQACAAELLALATDAAPASHSPLSLGESLARWARFGGADDGDSNAQAARCEETLLLLAQRVRRLSDLQRRSLDEREFLRRNWDDVAATISRDANQAKRLWVQALLCLNSGRDDMA